MRWVLNIMKDINNHHSCFLINDVFESDIIESGYDDDNSNYALT